MNKLELLINKHIKLKQIRLNAIITDIYVNSSIFEKEILIKILNNMLAELEDKIRIEIDTLEK